MVNPTDSSAPLAPAISQHTGLSSVQQASDDGCNDDPPPLPGPPADSLPAGGVPRPNYDPQPGHLTAPPSSSGDHQQQQQQQPQQPQQPQQQGPPVVVRDYGAYAASAAVMPAGDELLQTRSNEVGSDTAAASTLASPSPSSNSSTIAVDALGAADDAAAAADVPRLAAAASGYDGSNAHTVDVAVVAAALDVKLSHGLASDDARARLARDGPNKLSADDGITWFGVLLRQVSNSLTLVLVIAMVASYSMLDYVEGSVIAAVIGLNIVIGFVQDYRAEKTMQSLHSLSAPEATVVRDAGRVAKIKAEDLVCGDVVKIHVGDVVPADLRLFDAMNLETNEALLTGESLPIHKHPDSLASNDLPLQQSQKLPQQHHAHDRPIGDRHNIVWASSTVTKGRGLGVVVATGMETEVGRIAELLRGKKQREGGLVRRFLHKTSRSAKNVLGLVGTPLQVKLSKFALLLFSLAILLAIIVFSVAKWKINDEVLIYGICVAVAVIPESLIAVLTITMAVGTKTMAKGHVIVRKMQALEAVGGVTNICSDKTGTLTQGKMIARKAYIPGLGQLLVEGVEGPFDPTSGRVVLLGGHGRSNDDVVIDGDLVTTSSVLEHFLEGIAICNLSTVSRNDDTSFSSPSEKPPSPPPSVQWTAQGEPTEISLQVLAMRFGKGKDALLATGDWELLAEHPFDSTIKKMTIVHHHRGRDTVEAFMKGAGEVIVPTLNMSDIRKDEIMGMIERMAGEGLRVLCVAHKRIDRADAANRAAVEHDMNFVGLVGLYDPPRPETHDAVRRCQVAGVAVHMLTGDHIRTATAIAHEVGILAPAMPASLAGSMVMTAGAFDALSDPAVDALPQLPLVIARCSPATKVRMVEALHRRGAFCVMTGDGVNDSPALKRADVGIAMGLSGSDVAKDAADLVLTDDNFASIVRAVEEGRRLFDNIQKFIMHLLISNISQVVLLLAGLAFQDRNRLSVFPLSPLEILWVNMITSSFLALGLGLEEASPDVMTRPPHDLKAGVFTWEVIIDKSLYGLTMGVLCLVSFAIVIFGASGGQLGRNCNHGFSPECEPVFRARATVFAVLSFLLLLTAWEVKHFSRSLFNLYPERGHTGPTAVFHAVWYNRFLFWAVAAGFVVTFPVIYIPVFNAMVFKHTAITWEWAVVAGCCAVYLAVVEGWKAVKRCRRWGATAARHHLQKGKHSDLEAGYLVR